ncbi:MAG: DUF4115 domain-containing protein [Phototrophicales bacterium]|nr:DUF4115 domain-containing protein [Phototrophicales bacterium]
MRPYVLLVEICYCYRKNDRWGHFVEEDVDSYSLGRYLHDAREQKELTLDQATATLKIRRKVLEAFEQGDFSVSADLSQVQIRGFLRNYARYLGLDEDVVMTYYDSAQNPRNRRGHKAKGKGKGKKNGKSARLTNQPTAPVPLADPRKLASSIPQNQQHLTLSDERDLAQQRFLRFINLMAVIVVSLIAMGVIVFVVMQLVVRPTDETIPQSDILAELPNRPTFTLAPTFTPRFEASPLPQSVSQYNGVGVLVVMSAQSRTWVRVTVDGAEQLARLLLPNEQVEFLGISEIIVNASNATALNVIYNGQQQGSFGGRGQAVQVTFRDRGNPDILTGPGYDPTSAFTSTPTVTSDLLALTLIVARTPTATDGPSPTPTDTPTVTNTPTITNTPTETFTPSVTPTASDTPSVTPTASDTPPPSATPTITPTPTVTLTPSITPTASSTAVLPPRNTPSNPIPTKSP